MKSDRVKFLERQAQSFEQAAQQQSQCNWSPMDNANLKHLKNQAEYFRQELRHEKEREEK